MTTLETPMKAVAPKGAWSSAAKSIAVVSGKPHLEQATDAKEKEALKLETGCGSQEMEKWLGASDTLGLVHSFGSSLGLLTPATSTEGTSQLHTPHSSGPTPRRGGFMKGDTVFYGEQRGIVMALDYTSQPAAADVYLELTQATVRVPIHSLMPASLSLAGAFGGFDVSGLMTPSMASIPPTPPNNGTPRPPTMGWESTAGSSSTPLRSSSRTTVQSTPGGIGTGIGAGTRGRSLSTASQTSTLMSASASASAQSKLIAAAMASVTGLSTAEGSSIEPFLTHPKVPATTTVGTTHGLLDSLSLFQLYTGETGALLVNANSGETTTTSGSGGTETSAAMATGLPAATGTSEMCHEPVTVGSGEQFAAGYDYESYQQQWYAYWQWLYDNGYWDGDLSTAGTFADYATAGYYAAYGAQSQQCSEMGYMDDSGGFGSRYSPSWRPKPRRRKKGGKRKTKPDKDGSGGVEAGDGGVGEEQLRERERKKAEMSEAAKRAEDERKKKEMEERAQKNHFERLDDESITKLPHLRVHREHIKEHIHVEKGPRDYDSFREKKLSVPKPLALRKETDARRLGRGRRNGGGQRDGQRLIGDRRLRKARGGNDAHDADRRRRRRRSGGRRHVQSEKKRVAESKRLGKTQRKKRAPAHFATSRTERSRGKTERKQLDESRKKYMKKSELLTEENATDEKKAEKTEAAVVCDSETKKEEQSAETVAESTANVLDAIWAETAAVEAESDDGDEVKDSKSESTAENSDTVKSDATKSDAQVETETVAAEETDDTQEQTDAFEQESVDSASTKPALETVTEDGELEAVQLADDCGSTKLTDAKTEEEEAVIEEDTKKQEEEDAVIEEETVEETVMSMVQLKPVEEDDSGAVVEEGMHALEERNELVKGKAADGSSAADSRRGGKVQARGRRGGGRGPIGRGFPAQRGGQRRTSTHSMTVRDKGQLRKTEMCENWVRYGCCRYSHKCHFAHGFHEMKWRMRGVNYKTEPCCDPAREDAALCLFGSRCNFAHPGDAIRCTMRDDYVDAQYLQLTRRLFVEEFPFGIYL